MVVREPALPHRIAITLPLAEEEQAFRWRLQHESGAEDRGECVPADLEAAGHCDLDGQAFVRRVLPLDMPVEPGYHRFILERADGQGEPAEMSPSSPPPPATRRRRSRARDARGVSRPSFTASAPNATGASATSATCAI